MLKLKTACWDELASREHTVNASVLPQALYTTQKNRLFLTLENPFTIDSFINE
jgi:hypothetical protein